MNIVVCIKQVPDTSDVRIDPTTNNLVREGIPCIMNPCDRNAIEEALKIKDRMKCKVITISMGPPQAINVLQESLDMGADRAILLSDRTLAGSDTLATGYVISELIKTLDSSLVICGAEAIDGSTGQVGPSLAENLGWPHITYVNEIIQFSKTEISISREVKEVYEHFKCSLPVLICVIKGINDPRACKESEKRPELFDLKSLGLDINRIGINGSPTRVDNIVVSNRRSMSFVVVDSSLSADERIELIVNGGMKPKKVNLLRGRPADLAKLILNDETFARYLNN